MGVDTGIPQTDERVFLDYTSKGQKNLIIGLYINMCTFLYKDKSFVGTFSGFQEATVLFPQPLFMNELEQGALWWYHTIVIIKAFVALPR